MKLEEVQYKLLSDIQSLPPEIGLDKTKEALREIYKEYNWSFLRRTSYLKTPALINTGTVEVTEGSASVVVNADVKAILDALTINDVSIIGRQFRTFGGQIAGSNLFYNIIGYDSPTSTLTIDPIYQDATNTAAQFQIFKNLYAITEAGFASLDYIYAPFVQRRLGLEWSLEDLEKKDPNRLAFGDPYTAVPFGEDAASNQLIELYPVPSNARLYKFRYRIDADNVNFEPDDELPSALSLDLVKAKAKIKSYEWLITNADKVGDKRSPNIFMNLIAMISNPNMENSYPKMLEKAKMKDENLHPQMLIDLGDSYPFYQEVIVETILMDF